MFFIFPKNFTDFSFIGLPYFFRRTEKIQQHLFFFSSKA